MKAPPADESTRQGSETWINPTLSRAQGDSSGAAHTSIELTTMRGEAGANPVAQQSHNAQLSTEGERTGTQKLVARCWRWTKSFVRVYPKAPILDRMQINIDYLNRFNREEMNLLYQAYCLSQYRPNVLRLTVVIMIGVFAFFGYEGVKLVQKAIAGISDEKAMSILLASLTVGPLCIVIFVLGFILWLEFTKPCWKFITLMILTIGFATAILFNTMGFWSEMRQKRQNIYDMFDAPGLAYETGQMDNCTTSAEEWLEEALPHYVKPFRMGNWEEAKGGIRTMCGENVMCTFFVLDLECVDHRRLPSLPAASAVTSFSPSLRSTRRAWRAGTLCLQSHPVRPFPSLPSPRLAPSRTDTGLASQCPLSTECTRSLRLSSPRWCIWTLSTRFSARSSSSSGRSSSTSRSLHAITTTILRPTGRSTICSRISRGR